MGPGLGGGEVAAGQVLPAPHAIPGTLLTADPVPFSLSHPSSHLTTHHPATPHSHPTSSPAPACPTHHAQHRAENPPHLLPSCAGVLPAHSITPLGSSDQKQIPPLQEFAASPTPHSPAVLPGPGPSCCPSVILETRATTEGLLAVSLRVRGHRVCSPPCNDTWGH